MYHGSSFGYRIASNCGKTVPIFDKQTGSILDRSGSQLV